MSAVFTWANISLKLKILSKQRHCAEFLYWLNYLRLVSFSFFFFYIKCLQHCIQLIFSLLAVANYFGQISILLCMCNFYANWACECLYSFCVNSTLVSLLYWKMFLHTEKMTVPWITCTGILNSSHGDVAPYPVTTV